MSSEIYLFVKLQPLYVIIKKPFYIKSSYDEIFKVLSATLKHYILCAIILGTSIRLDAQEDVHVKVAKFSILIETSGDEIKLICSDGCAWKELSFRYSIYSEPQAVDQFGMTTLPRNQINPDALLSNFLFTIKKTQEGVSLVGKEGTIWPSLTFDCAGDRCFKRIDGWGVADGKKN